MHTSGYGVECGGKKRINTPDFPLTVSSSYRQEYVPTPHL